MGGQEFAPEAFDLFTGTGDQFGMGAEQQGYYFTPQPLQAPPVLNELGQPAVLEAPQPLRAETGLREPTALGRPYQEQGRQLQAAAQRGELSPVAQQSLQALRARLAQGAQSRGGVGAAQAMQQVENFRQQLLQQQLDFGLRLAQIGDQYAAGAIRTGLQADQYVNNLTNQFFTNVARTLFSQPAQTQQPRPPGG
jgi:hypothetical protein